MNKVFMLLGLSILVIAVGIFLILAGQEELPAAEPAGLTEQSLQDSLVESQNLIINASKSAGNDRDNAASDLPELVRGSEEWCEMMMQKNNNQWSEADTQLFGLKCLN